MARIPKPKIPKAPKSYVSKSGAPDTRTKPFRSTNYLGKLKKPKV